MSRPFPAPAPSPSARTLRGRMTAYLPRLSIRLIRIGLVVFLLAVAWPGPAATADSAGYALQFDGINDEVELPETSSIMVPGWQTTKTVSLWVKPLGAAAPCANNTVGFCDAVFGDRSRWWGIVRGILNGQDRLWAWNYDGSPGSPADLIKVDYTVGEWVHVSLVHSDGSLRVYRNGVQVGMTPSGATLQPYAGAMPRLHLGGIINSPTRNWTFEGILDEVSLWSVARSEAEVQADMFHSLSGTEPGLLAYYSMSNGAGTVLDDDGLGSWDGTLLDGALGVPPNGGAALWVPSDAFGQSYPTPTPGAGTPSATATPTDVLSATPDASVTPTPTATATATSTTPAAGFPGTGLLDTFDRADGPIGATWSGTTGSFAVSANRLDVNGNGNIFWNPAAFGAEQEVYVTVAVADPTAGSLSLLLKSQSSTSANSGAMRLLYGAASQTVQLLTFAPGAGWVAQGPPISLMLSSGDQFGARAHADGTVDVFKNGALVGTRTATGWPHAGAGGYVGLWAASASNVVLDSLGGGTPGGIPTATVTSSATAGPTATASPTATAPPPSPTPTTGLTATATPVPPTPTTGPTATATVSGSFPSTDLVDSFNRPDGPLGASWTGSPGNFAIAGNQLDVVGNGAIFWSASTFGPQQEVFLTLVTIDPGGNSISLLLKSQSSTTANAGAARVLYSPGSQTIQVWTYAAGQGWVQRGANLSASLTNGDALGARSTSGGTIEVYRNGALLGSRDITAWTHATAGGYIGLWAASVPNAVIDNFGGGTAGAN